MQSEIQNNDYQKYYVPAQSPWPIVGAVALFLIAVGAGNFVVEATNSGTTFMYLPPGPYRKAREAAEIARPLPPPSPLPPLPPPSPLLPPPSSSPRPIPPHSPDSPSDARAAGAPPPPPRPSGARPVAQPLPVGGMRLPRGQGRVPRRLLLHHVDGRAPPLRAPLAPLRKRRPRQL